MVRSDLRSPFLAAFLANFFLAAFLVGFFFGEGNFFGFLAGAGSQLSLEDDPDVRVEVEEVPIEDSDDASSKVSL